MKNHEKLYWRVRNTVEMYFHLMRGWVYFQKTKETLKGLGCLSSKKDVRDFTSQTVGVANYVVDKTIESISLAKYQFDQAFFNICVFAAMGLALSNRYKMRISIRWIVKCARREGYITGNGFSFVRAAPKVIQKYGVVPYKYCPDETNMDWETYSAWTGKDETLLKVGEQYKTGNYWQVRNEQEVIALLQQGIPVTTAAKWYSSMNRPLATLFYLMFSGDYIGGHSFHYGAYRKFGADFGTPQTFGPDYGDKGMAWIPVIFGPNFYEIYAVEGLTEAQQKMMFLDVFNGWMVRTKGDSRCYVIKDGGKYYVETMEDFWKVSDKITQAKVDQDVLQSILDAIPLVKSVDDAFISTL